MKINKRKIKQIILIIISVILLFSIYLNTYLLIKYNVLPIKYLIIYFIIVGIIPFILIFFTVFKRIKVVLKNILVGIEIFYIIILFIVFFFLNQTFHFLDAFTSGFDYETKNYNVIVLKDSEYEQIKDLEDKNIGYAKNLDISINDALVELDKKVTLQHQEYESISELLDSLKNKEVDSILLSDSFYDLLDESEDAKISDSTKIIYEFSVREKMEDIGKDVDVTKETFNVYVSGIDSYGNVTDKTRSDVNIIMSINPKTNKILMINIPRDYYVKLDGFNREDKLTHAGMYGVDMSVKTIENLLDTEINYYIKVNYKALVSLVDGLGGVNVYSKYDFYSTDYNYHFKKGYNEVNGHKALDFVRTRKAFLDGDRARGENQQAMIEAIIKKASNPSILLKYDNILNSLEGNFTTNISTNNLMSFVNMQLDKMPNWKVTSISLNGSDSYNYTYTYPSQELYVMVPDEETVNDAKLALENNK